MVIKLIVLTAFVAYANAGVLSSSDFTYAAAPAFHSVPLAYAAPLAKAVVAKTIDTEHDPHPQYSYSYDVQDHLTGDSKTQHETRDGDVVHGSYSLLESDGTRRVVHYTADDHNGFNAVVEKQPATAAVAVKTIAPIPVSYATAAAATPYLKTVAPIPVSYAAAAPTPYVKTVAHAPTLAYPSSALAYPTPVFKTYAAATPVIKTVAAAAAPLAYSPSYPHTYESQYAHAYPAPIITKYSAAPTYAYSGPVGPLAYGAIPVAHAEYASAHQYASRY